MYSDDEDVVMNFRRKRSSVAVVIEDDDEARLLRKLKKKKGKPVDIEVFDEGYVSEDEEPGMFSSDEEDEEALIEFRTEKAQTMTSTTTMTKKEKKKERKDAEWRKSSRRRWVLNSLWYDTVMEKMPPLCSGEIGIHRISDNAYCVNVDVSNMSRSHYNELLYFSELCHKKRHLALFDHPGDPSIGGLASAQGDDLEDPDHLDVVMSAIEEYQKLNQNVDLKLLKLLKMTWALWVGMRYFMTFSAVDAKTGKESIYQAAIAEQAEVNYLGLFRDTCEDKVLAIISLTGAPPK